MERREAERILAEQIGAMAELRGVQCRPMVATGDPFDGILRTAAALQCGSHRHGRAPQAVPAGYLRRDDRRARDPHGTISGADGEQRSEGRPYRTVLAAVDMSEPSANAIKVAQATGLIDGAQRHASSMRFIPLAKAKMSMAGIGSSQHRRVRCQRAPESRRGTGRVPGSERTWWHGWSLRVEEGRAFEVISRAVEETRPDLLVIGNPWPLWAAETAARERDGRGAAYLWTWISSLCRPLEDSDHA